jgi:hypothetical protein
MAVAELTSQAPSPVSPSTQSGKNTVRMLTEKIVLEKS